MRRLGAEKVSQELPPLLSPSVFVSEKRTPFFPTLPALLQEFVLTAIVGPQVRAKFSVSSQLRLLLSDGFVVTYGHLRPNILSFARNSTALPR